MNQFRKTINCLHLLAVLALLATGRAVCAAESGNLTVFANGSSSVYLDLPSDRNAIPAQCGPSIDDLRRCFQTMTGVPLPEKARPGLIPIRVKLLPAEDRAAAQKPFGLQGYEITVQSDGITLAAPTALGIVNSIFHILDSWGCRWVMPGEMGEVIPHNDHLTLPLGSQRYWPGSDSRILTAGPLGKRDANELAAWVRRNRMATQRRISGQHYYNYALPPDKYFKEHPEYYALIGGKRTPTQLCTSNPEVISLMIAAAKTWFKGSPEMDSFPMDPNDNVDFCQCDRCVALDPPGTAPDGLPLLTDRVIRFANEVARAIRADYPDKVVALYAYCNHTLPPVNVKPEPNIAIGLTRSNYCLLHLTPDSPCRSPRDFYALIKAWKPLVSSLYLYEYYPIAWTGLLPCPNYLEFAKTVRETRELGIVGGYEDSSWSFSNATFINDYLAIRLKCLPQLTADEALGDLCRGFFGPASRAMETYYKTMARVTEYTHPGRDVVFFDLYGYDEMFSPEIVAQARVALTGALDLASPGTLYRQRVEMVDIGHRYLEAYIEGIANAKAKKYQEAVAAFDRAEQLIDQLNDKCFTYSTKADAHVRIHRARLRFLAEYCPQPMGMITRWTLLGPFNNDARDAQITRDPFEPIRAIGGPVKLKDGSEAKWRKYASPAGFLDFKKAFAADASSWRFFYAYAGVVAKSSRNRNAQLRMDSFWPFRVYLNGKEVFGREGANADAPDNIIVNVNLAAGDNTIVFKCSQIGDSGILVWPWRLYCRITDESGMPLKDVKIAN